MRINEFYPYSSIRRMTETSNAISRSLTRLATGKRINSPSDNPADFARAINLETASRGIAQQIRGMNDARSLFATASNALESQMSILQKMRELSVQASNDILSTGDRRKLNDQLQNLILELDRVANQTQFNGLEVLNGNVPSLHFGDRWIDFTDVRGVGLFRKDLQAGDSAHTFSLEEPTGYAHSNSIIGTVILSDSGNGRSGIFTIDKTGNYETFDKSMSSFAAGNLTLSSDDGSFLSDDIDLDGDTDLIYNGISSGVVQIFQNDSGNFTEIYNKALNQTGEIVFGDFDNNGERDFVVASDTTVLMVAQTGGTFAGSTTVITLGSAITALAQIDINGAGDDLAIGAGTTLYTYGYSLGSFAQLDSEVTTYAITGILNNGDTNLYLESNGNSKIQNYALSTDGQLAALTALSFDQSNGVETYLSDINQDGFLDLIAITATDLVYGRLEVFLGSGTGSMSTSTLEASFEYYQGQGAWGDVSNDGIIDHIFFNDKNSELSFGVYTPAASGPITSNGQTAYSDLSLLTSDLAGQTMAYIDSAIDKLKGVQSQYAIEFNRLEIQQSAAERQVSVLAEARENILSADMATEVSELTRLQILQQAQMAVYSQSSLAMSLVLQLLDSTK